MDSPLLRVKIKVIKFLDIIDNFYNISNSSKLDENHYPHAYIFDLFNEEYDFSLSDFSVRDSNFKQFINRPIRNSEAFHKEAIFLEKFKLFYREVKSNVYSRLDLLSSLIEQNLQEILFEDRKSYVEFLFDFFQLGSLTDKAFLKFFKELWICLRLHSSEFDSKDFNYYKVSLDLHNRMRLWFSNISVSSPFYEDYDLHRAVFNRNTRHIYKICSNENKESIFCDINEKDLNGNTPLLLAIKLNSYDCIDCLCDNEANIHHKSSENDISPLEFAIILNNQQILSCLIAANKRQKYFYWESTKLKLAEYINTLPDFTLQINVNLFSKYLNLFGKSNKPDSISYCKKGKNFRLDIKLFNSSSFFPLFNSNCSILFQQRENKKTNIYMIYHESKICIDFIEYVLSMDNVNYSAETIMKNGIENQKYFFYNLIQENPSERLVCEYLSKDYISNGKLKITNLNIKDFGNKHKKLVFDSIYATTSSKTFEKYISKNSNIEKMENKIESNCKVHVADQVLMKAFSTFKLNNHKNNEKETKMNLTISENFPFQLIYLMPVLQVLSLISEEVCQIKSIVCSKIFSMGHLPLKLTIPVGLSFGIHFQVSSFCNSPPDDSYFEVNFDDPQVDSDIKSENNILEKENSLNSEYNNSKSSKNKLKLDISLINAKYYQSKQPDLHNMYFNSKDIVQNGGEVNQDKSKLNKYRHSKPQATLRSELS